LVLLMDRKTATATSPSGRHHGLQFLENALEENRQLLVEVILRDLAVAAARPELFVSMGRATSLFGCADTPRGRCPHGKFRFYAERLLRRQRQGATQLVDFALLLRSPEVREVALLHTDLRKRLQEWCETPPSRSAALGIPGWLSSQSETCLIEW
jgi:hypothetical protein